MPRKRSVSQKDGDDTLADSLMGVWESSVGETRPFLAENNIQRLIQEVTKGVGAIEELLVVVDGRGARCAFMGTSKNKIEMLFVSVKHRGKGIGSDLLNCAINALNVLHVGVNEQNGRTVRFYNKI